MRSKKTGTARLNQTAAPRGLEKTKEFTRKTGRWSTAYDLQRGFRRPTCRVDAAAQDDARGRPQFPRFRGPALQRFLVRTRRAFRKEPTARTAVRASDDSRKGGSGRRHSPRARRLKPAGENPMLGQRVCHVPKFRVRTNPITFHRPALRKLVFGDGRALAQRP